MNKTLAAAIAIAAVGGAYLAVGMTVYVTTGFDMPSWPIAIAVCGVVLCCAAAGLNAAWEIWHD